jgi:hypothetical protein
MRRERMKIEDVKKGMRVRVLPFAKDIDSHVTSFTTAGDMDQYLGEVFTVDGFRGGTVKFEEIGWCWAPEWLEPAEEEKKPYTHVFEAMSTTGTDISLPFTCGSMEFTTPGMRGDKRDKDSYGGRDMREEEKMFVEEQMDEVVKKTEVELIASFREEFWSDKIGERALIGGQGAVILEVSPSFERVRARVLFYENGTGNAYHRDDWFLTTSIGEFLGPSE